MWAIDAGHFAVSVPLVVVALALAALTVRWLRSIVRRRLAARWASTHGTILMTTIQVQRTGTARREVPVVMYAYSVGHEAFQGSRIRADDELRTLAVAGHARNVLARYPVGASVLVYYDPTNPTLSALER